MFLLASLLVSVLDTAHPAYFPLVKFKNLFSNAENLQAPYSRCLSGQIRKPFIYATLKKQVLCIA